jgi:hypothetical protein
MYEAIAKYRRQAANKPQPAQLCGDKGMAGPSYCILPAGHDGKHSYGIPQLVQEPVGRVTGDKQARLFKPLPHDTLLYILTESSSYETE